jgi:hypothetical protein
MLTPCGLNISTTLVLEVVSSHTDAGQSDLCAFGWYPLIHCQSLKMIEVWHLRWNTADPSCQLSDRQQLPPLICAVPVPHCEEYLCLLDALSP